MTACFSKQLDPVVLERNLAKELVEVVGEDTYNNSDNSSIGFVVNDDHFLFNYSEGMIDGNGECNEIFYDNDFNGNMDPHVDEFSLEGSFDACAQVYGEKLTHRIMDFAHYSDFRSTFPVDGFCEDELGAVNARYHIGLLREIDRFR